MPWFRCPELVEYDREASSSTSITVLEVYAEGITGSIMKRCPGDFQWAYLLEKRYPMSRLEEKYNIRMEQQTEGRKAMTFCLPDLK